MENQSHYDPSRKTVGAIYREAQMSHDGSDIIVGDMTNEMTKSFIEDLNDALKANPFQDKPYFIMFHEKKDLQMKSALLRRVLFFKFRPWPEDDTVVFWTNPKTGEVRFCWCLPHWSEMDNILTNESLFDKELVFQIKAWKRFELEQFGFMKNEWGNWTANPYFQDKPLESYANKPQKVLSPVIAA